LSKPKRAAPDGSIPVRTKPKDRFPSPRVDEALLCRLADTLLTIESIAKILQVPRSYLYDNYGDVLEQRAETRKSKLSEVMWHKALVERDSRMMIWLSKQFLGMRDTQPEVTSNVQFNIVCNEVPK